MRPPAVYPEYGFLYLSEVKIGLKLEWVLKANPLHN